MLTHHEEPLRRSVIELQRTPATTLDCRRHGDYVIWLGGSQAVGWCYVVTTPSGSNGPAGSAPGGEDVGRLFRTKTLALAQARARIRQLTRTTAQQRHSGRASILAITQRRTS